MMKENTHKRRLRWPLGHSRKRIVVVTFLVVVVLLRNFRVSRPPMSVYENLLMKLWATSTQGYQILAFAYPSSVALSKDDITLITHSSVDKLDNLLFQIERWNGPVSCAFYINSRNDIQKLTGFLTKHAYTLRQTSVHVLLESSRKDYPMNLLRNLALDHMQSDYFLAMDVDFVTDHDAYRHLKQELDKHTYFYETLHQKTLFVLPAFERFMPSEMDDWFWKTSISKEMIPDSRTELLTLIQRKQASPFHEQFKKGHAPTNYEKWYLVSEEFSYPIEYAHRFEPYVVGYRHGVPRYWSNFRGFGFNKASWFHEFHLSGYKFEVVRDHFCIHKNHPKGGFGRGATQDMRLEWLNFKQYLFDQYDADRKPFRDYFDRYGDEKWQRAMNWNGSHVLVEET